jgi:hypothetical protein
MQSKSPSGRAAPAGDAVSRKLRLQRTHHLIRKVPHAHRYHLSDTGRTIVTAPMAARNVDTQDQAKMVA